MNDDQTNFGPGGAEPCTPARTHLKNYEQPPEYWAEGFALHQITRQDERTLELRNPKDPNNWYTIAIDDDGQIVALGDNTSVIFGFKRTDTLAQRIAWIGSHETADPYVIEKARHGSPTQKLTTANAETFEADVREYFADLIAEGDYTKWIEQQLTWDEFPIPCRAIEALEHDNYWAISELGDHLSEIGCKQETEDYHALGQRTNGDVERAHAVLRRAHLLLTEQAK